MKEHKLKSKVLHLYEHTDEMPIELYNYANEYALLDNQIGSNMEDVKRHFQNFDTFIAAKDLDALAAERKNLHKCFFNIIDHTNYQGLQFGCYIHSIDNVKVFDYSQEGLKRLLANLSRDGLTVGVMKSILQELKKKS
jgi:hypothetical protein